MLTAGHADSFRTSCTYSGPNDLTAPGASDLPDGSGLAARRRTLVQEAAGHGEGARRRTMIVEACLLSRKPAQQPDLMLAVTHEALVPALALVVPDKAEPLPGLIGDTQGYLGQLGRADRGTRAGEVYSLLIPLIRSTL